MCIIRGRCHSISSLYHFHIPHCFHRHPQRAPRVVVARHQPLLELHIKQDNIFRLCVPNHALWEKDEDSVRSALIGKINSLHDPNDDAKCLHQEEDHQGFSFFIFLHFSAFASEQVDPFPDIFSKAQTTSFHPSHHQTTLNTLQLSEASVVPRDLFEDFQT